MDGKFRRIVQAEIGKGPCRGFNYYLIKLMNTDDPREAYLKFRTLTDRELFAARPTMKKWFGINGYATPRREMVIRIAFSLKLSIEQLEMLLTEGLGEPGLWVNDFREFIFKHGFYNKSTYYECLQMIDEIRIKTDKTPEFDAEYMTSKVEVEFESKKHLSKEELLDWMVDNFRIFKGYTNTVVRYFESYKRAIVKYVREEAVSLLDSALAETNFKRWIKSKKIEFCGNERKLINEFVEKNKSYLSPSLVESIQELTKIAYSTLEPNKLVLEEIYSVKKDVKIKESECMDVQCVSAKYLSDMFRFHKIKYRYLVVIQALKTIDDLKEEEECPDWIIEIVRKYSNGKMVATDKESVRTWLVNDEKAYRRRRITPGRKDMLPLIHYVAQKKYIASIGNSYSHYNVDEAKELFLNMANTTLQACNMTCIDEKNGYDAMLLLCFQPDEMYSYHDLLEAIYS